MREKKIPIYKRIAAFVFAFILAFNCMEPGSLNIMAEEGENYNVTINWRTDDNSAVSPTPGKKAIDTDVNGEVENIFMGIQVSNSNADPKLYPGELTITLNNLDGLKRGDSEYKFVTDDPVFTSVWDLVRIKTDNVTGEIEYTITNKNIIEKDMRSTLHWTVGARDAVGYDESTASGGYEKTIQANYVINRYSRDDDGNFVTNDAFKYALVYDAGSGDYVATGDMSYIGETFYAKDPDDCFIDKTGGIIKDDRVAVGNAFAGTGSTEGSVIYVDALGNKVNDETEARPVDESGYLLNLKYDESTNDYVLTDVDGTPLDLSTEGYDTLLDAEKTKLVWVGLKIPEKKEYHSSDFCAYSSPENGVNTNSIDFSMNTTIDTITNDLEYVNDPDAGDALPSGYVYRKFKIDLKQTKKARGIDQSSLFVAIEPTEGLTAENLTKGETIIYDANNNPTTIVSEEINGKTYYGFYCFQDASGDINSYKTQFTIGIKKDLVTAATGSKIDVAVRDIYIAKFNDETEEKYYIGYKDSEMQNDLNVLPTTSDETDFTANGAERTFYAGGIGLTKSSSFEESNHSKPSGDNKKLLSGLVFGSQTVNFDMNVSVNKTDVTSLTPDALLHAFSVEPSFEVATQSSPPNKLTQPYDLIVGDDTTAARYEISGEDKSYILKPGVDYRFTSVTIPSGIYKYNEVDGQQVKKGYPYEIYTADVNADGTLNWGTTPALSGETDPNSSIEKSIYAAAFYIKIRNLDVALSNKKFSAKANFSLDPMNEDYQFFMGTDADSFGSSNARLVNYNFMQVLVNRDNTAGGKKNMDLASVTDPFSRLDTSGYTDYRSALDTNFTTQNKDRYFIDKTGTAGYLRRAYSNVYLRTSVTRLGSTTRYTNSEYTLSAQEALKKPRRWNNSLTTTGTLQSENPGALKTFSLYVELPNKVELTDSSGNINKDALQSIFDKMTFSATDYISSIVPGQSARTLSKSDLRLGDNTFLDFDEANNRIIVRFDFTENPILASDLTKVTLNYDVLYIQDDSKENAGDITVTSYTVLTDAGHKILESQGTTTADVNDLDENHVNQTIVSSNGSARLTITDEQVTIDTHKFVKTAYSNGAYVKSSKVQVLTDGGATRANQKYSYKLDFRKKYVGDGKADENKIKTIILYDEIEQYMNDASANSVSVLNSKWQGTFEYADANECADLLTDFTPTLWYRTTFDSSTWGDDFYGINRKNREDFSAMLRTLDPATAGYSEDDLASAGWIKGKDIDASGRLYPQNADEGKVKVAVIVLSPRMPDQELENGKELNYFVTLHMIAPPAIVNGESIVNTKALNMFFMEDTAFLVSDPDSCKASDDTEVLLANSLKIKKVDYNNTSFALAGYTDAHGEYKGAKFNVYEGSANHSTTGGYVAPNSIPKLELQEYHDFDDSSYNEVPLLKKSVGINGVLELALPEGFYIIREVEAPEGYEIDDDYYLVHFKSDGKAELMGAYTGKAPDPETGVVEGSITLDHDQSAEAAPKMDEDNAIISIKDKPNFKGQITFEKKVLQTGETLQGVEYQLREFEESGGYASVSVIEHKENNVVQTGEYDYAKGEIGVNMVTDANGKIVIHNLPAGYYSVLETSAPEGYLVDNGDKTFAITYETTKEGADEDSERIWIDTENGTTDELTGDTSYSDIYSLTDSQIESDISVTKTDTSGAPLKGASYTLYRYKNGSSMTAENAVRDIINNGVTGTGMTCFKEIESKTTSSSGTVTFSGLAFGTYYVRETSAPIGYRRSDDFNSSGDLTGRVIVIDSHGAATRYDAGNGIKTPYRVSQKDEKKLGEVEINKTDTNGNALPGAKFRVFKLTDKPVGSAAHNTVLYDTTSYVIAYSNKDDDWRRYDALEGTNAGTFETTNGKVKISGLDWGDDIEYCICEVSAPEGFEKADPVMVSVTKFDVYNAQPIFISDEKVKGRATLTKTAKDNGSLQEGVEFQLYYRPMREPDDEVTAYTPQKFTDNGSGSYTLDPEGSVSILVTNSSGQIKLDGLTWGDYYFKETKPLEGYKTAENITFSVNANSCLSNQQLSCEDEKGKAQITIDKVLKEDPYLYKDAFGEPTFIFKIRQIRSLNDHQDPETGAKVYTAYLNFDGLTAASDANKTRKTSPIDVEKGFYEISEISVSRYKPRGDVTTPSTVSIGTTITDADISLDTTNHVVYCDLTGSGADDVPTYEAQFDNEIMRYDKLSHTDNAENTFSAAEDYIVGFRLSYPHVIPINENAATGVSTDLNKSDFKGYWRYRSGLEEAMTPEERESVTYSLPSYSTGSWKPVDNDPTPTLTVENGTAVAGASYRENAAVTKDGKTFDYEVTLNYASYTPPKIKYLTLYPDTGGYYTITDNTTSEKVGSALYKFSQQGSGALDLQSGDYSYKNGDRDPETHAKYVFSHWTRLNDDNEPVNPATEKYTLDEVMDYVKTNDGSAFRFRAQMEEWTKSTVMLLAGAADNNTGQFRTKLQSLYGNKDNLVNNFKYFKHGSMDDMTNALESGGVNVVISQPPSDEYPATAYAYKKSDNNNTIWWCCSDDSDNPTMAEITGNTFNGLTNLETVEIDYWDLSKLKNTRKMFMDCKNLTAVNNYSNTTAYIINMNDMFQNCERLYEFSICSHFVFDENISSNAVNASPYTGIANTFNGAFKSNTNGGKPKTDDVVAMMKNFDFSKPPQRNGSDTEKYGGYLVNGDFNSTTGVSKDECRFSGFGIKTKFGAVDPHTYVYTNAKNKVMTVKGTIYQTVGCKIIITTNDDKSWSWYVVPDDATITKDGVPMTEITYP